MQEFSNIDWALEQRKDAAINRIIEILETGFKPSSKELQYEHIEVREYLRDWKKLKYAKMFCFIIQS